MQDATFDYLNQLYEAGVQMDEAYPEKNNMRLFLDRIKMFQENNGKAYKFVNVAELLEYYDELSRHQHWPLHFERKHYEGYADIEPIADYMRLIPPKGITHAFPNEPVVFCLDNLVIKPHAKIGNLMEYILMDKTAGLLGYDYFDLIHSSEVQNPKYRHYITGQPRPLHYKNQKEVAPPLLYLDWVVTIENPGGRYDTDQLQPA